MPAGLAELALGLVLGGVSGFILALVLGSRPLEPDGAEGEKERLRRELTTLEVRLAEHAEALRALPDLLRQMFAAGGRRATAPLALGVVERLLRPEQCAIFVTRPAQLRLVLAEGHGLPPSLIPGLEIEYGQGRVGHVAQTQRALDEEDFRKVSDLLKESLAATDLPGLRAEVLAPVLDHTGLVGVLTAGGVRSGPGAAKALLKVAAEVTALALGQQSRLRAALESSNLDDLTGVSTKRHFQCRIEDELQRAGREGVPLGLLLLDLDHFKGYNDAAGHREGDELLRRLGQILRGSIREDDVAARYGGEEFAILYPGSTKAQAQRLAEGIRRAVEAHPFPHRGHQPLRAVTISGGVSAFPEDADNAVDLIRAADRALGQAKASGRNCIRPA